MRLSLSISILILAIMIPLASAKMTAVGPQFEIHENDDGRTAKIYSYLKYFPHKDGPYFKEWDMIAEQFETKGCDFGYSYCQPKDNYFKTHAKTFFDTDETIAWESKGEKLYMELESININSAPSITPHFIPLVYDNQITYFLNNDIWVTYTYLPDRLKEEIYINNTAIKNPLFKDMNITFKVTGTSNQAIVSEKFLICDSSGVFCDYLPVKSNTGNIKIEFNKLKWFSKKEAQLPFIIDPEIKINGSNLTSNVYTLNKFSFPTQVQRFTDTNFGVGDHDPTRFSDNNRHYRALVHFNTTGIPDDASISNVTASFHFNKIATEGGAIHFTHLDGYETDYANDGGVENLKLNQDCQNGSKYGTIPEIHNEANLSIGTFELNSSAWEDIEDRLADENDFAFGIYAEKEYNNVGFKQGTIIASRLIANESRRWWVNITYLLPFELNLTSPLNQTYNYTLIWLNATNSTEIHTWIYNWNGSNQTFEPNIQVNFTEGHHLLRLWANDTEDLINHSQVWFNVSLPIEEPPEDVLINLTSPLNQTYNYTMIWLNVTNQTEVEAWWYNWNGTNYTFEPNITINFTEGHHLMNVWANNSGGVENTSSVWFNVSLPVSEPPLEAVIINLTSPLNQTYNYTVIWVNVTNDTEIESWWYNWNGTNYSFEPNITINFTNGTHLMTVWANDSAGTENSSSVWFTVLTVEEVVKIYIWPLIPMALSFMFGILYYINRKEMGLEILFLALALMTAMVSFWMVIVIAEDVALNVVSVASSLWTASMIGVIVTILVYFVLLTQFVLKRLR